MRQKIESYKKEIRRSQINAYFNSVRIQLQSTSQQREISLIINQERQKRSRILALNQPDSSMENLSSSSQKECSIFEHWDHSEGQILRLKDQNNFEPLVQILKDIYRQLKKVVVAKGNNMLFERKEEVFECFLQKNILSNAVESITKAFSMGLNGGLLQSLTIQAINILSLCIKVLPSKFNQQVLLNSNLFLFLRCCIEEPKHDYQHLSRVIGVITHMIIASDCASKQLTNILNDRKSPFHVGAIFYNISKMPLRTNEELTQNFINMMMHYLEGVQEQISRAKKDNVAIKGTNFTCLTLSELEIALEISVSAVNNLFGICMESTEEVNYLDEALDVFRIIIENFDVRESFKNKVNFRKLLQLLAIKDCIVQIKTKILAIIDHLIYKDNDGSFSEMLIKECQMLDILWGIKDDLSTYVMNIMCNIALDANLKNILSRYIHNIYLKLSLDSNDVMLYTFIYNWFSSQDFKIQSSSDKIMVMTLRDSEQDNLKIAELQCAFWYNLAKANEVQIPERILHYNFPIVRKIKQQILSLESQSL